MPQIACREATDLDVPALARIRAAVWGTEDYWKTRMAAYMRRELHPRHALDPRVVYVACERETVVGLIAGHLTRRFSCEGELEWIDVIDAWRRQGVASALLRHLATWFVQENAARICVDVDPDNTVAQAFYRRHGARDLRPHWLAWPDISVVLGKGDAWHPGHDAPRT
jgi:ribosomal protein S18 acetylase RimI-like enzyme